MQNQTWYSVYHQALLPIISGTLCFCVTLVLAVIGYVYQTPTNGFLALGVANIIFTVCDFFVMLYYGLLCIDTLTLTFYRQAFKRFYQHYINTVSGYNGYHSLATPVLAYPLYVLTNQ